MLPKAVVPLAIALASLGTVCSPASAAETLKLDLASVGNLNPSTAVVQSAPLVAGTKYVISVSGTGSIWSTDQQSPITCGLPEAKLITEPSPGQPAFVANLDAALLFAAPQGIWLGSVKACYGSPGEPVGVPPLRSGFRFGPAGSMAFHAPTGGMPAAPAASHVYTYAVTGAGVAQGFQYLDKRVDDNSGIFTIVVRTETECAAVNCTTLPVTPTTPMATTPAATDTTPAAPPIAPPVTTPSVTTQPTTPAPEDTQPTISTFSERVVPVAPLNSAPADALSPLWSKPVTTPAECVSLSVLAVQLRATKVSFFTKAVYSINGKKLATVEGSKLFSSKTEKAVAVQKFRKLLPGVITLKVVVTLKNGKTITEKRTYARCTRPTKAAKKITVAL